jgi:aspartate carbamoyltransferase catalytic subunit
MIHLIDTSDFSIDQIQEIFKNAQDYKDNGYKQTLKNRTIITIFFENSTRTKSSFEIASKNLGANVISLDVSKSSTSKGETMFDTSANLDAMNPDAIIVRHKSSGAPQLLSKSVNCPIINGGDGSHAHPTQALLDMFTILQYHKNIDGLKVAIVGDIKNSRVANSNIKLLTRFGADVILVSPPHFKTHHNLRFETRLEDIIDEVDVIISLRTQTERHQNQIYASLEDYANDYCITQELIGDRDIILLHPGPVHRNIDISDNMLNDSRSKVLEQVENGVYIRMAVLNQLICHNQ